MTLHLIYATKPLQDVVITASELCDNTPRGGVRFCHRLTLLGQGQQLTLPEVRTPLAAPALREQLQRFIAGAGSSRLSWSSPAPAWPLRTLAIALLLSVVTWGWWDLRWPPQQPSQLASDGQTPRHPKTSSTTPDRQD